MKLPCAIAVSALVHAAFASIIAVWFSVFPSERTIASLDLSSVELSFTDDSDSELEAVSAPASAAEVPRKVLPPEALPPDFVVAESETAIPPQPEVAMPSVPTPEIDELTPVEVLQRSVASDATVSAPTPPSARIDAMPQLKKPIRPEYPIASRQRGEQGDVLLELVVGADGRVTRTVVVKSSGYKELDDAACKAAMSAKLKPAKSGGRSVESVARVTLEFRLTK